MATLKELLREIVAKKGSDLHLTVGVPPVIRLNGKLVHTDHDPLTHNELDGYVKEILTLDEYRRYNSKGELDKSYSLNGVGRYRVNVFKQREHDAIAIRLIGLKIPELDTLHLPPVVRELTTKKRGLILVTGPTGSGKSTTLAAIINEINETRADHILTLEDPIEYLHRHKKSIVNQREIGNDSANYNNALTAALREDPDVILIGEMRDLDSISIAITAAETGHLVFSTLHTIGAAKTIDRIIDVFPPHQQQQVKVQLSGVLKGVISQQLLPLTEDRGRCVALEVMTVTPAIQSLIREGKTHQIQSSVQTGSKYGMQTMDMAIADLYRKNEITIESAMEYAVALDALQRMLYV